MYNEGGEFILGLGSLHFFQIFVLVAGVMSLAACSSTPEMAMPEAVPAYQTVSVNTPGVYGAECSLKTGQKSYSVSAPGSVQVARTPDVMQVRCQKGAHMVGTEQVKPLFSPSDPRLYSGDCQSCTYPGMVTVAMAINPGSLQTNIRHWP
jgi:hypothetical protein